MDFRDKTAIVTGAGQGIGFEICRQLAKNGATVLLNDIDKDLSDKAAAKITMEDGSCISVPGDCGDINFVSKLVQRSVAETGHLDIVIANAGITLFGDFLSYPADSLYSVLNLNIAGTFFLAQAASRQIR